MLYFAVGLTAAADSPSSQPSDHHGAQARQVMDYIQKTFWDPAKGIYTKTAQDRTPDYVWREAAAFSALVGAARHEPQTYRPILALFFRGLEAYWDAKVPIPAYEPSPTRGNGHDKYYDDNAWLVITFLEGYELTGDLAYFTRARETGRFVLSGWDEKLGGGIWWHQSHKDDSKNACANGPAAVGFLYLARLGPANEAGLWLNAARKTVDWTVAKLQAADGLFDDRIVVTTGEVKHGKLTYNSALMLRADLGLYRQTARSDYLGHAKRIGKAAEWFCDKQTGVYRDPLKWSQFMVEADLDLYRATGDEDLLRRARANADAYYASWSKQAPADMMSNVATARILWLLADMETPAGRAFWAAAEKPVEPRR
jgi:uncharacterized protein YyaL (SSP411 family)